MDQGPPIKRPRLNELENPQPLMRDLNQSNNAITLTLATHGGGSGGGQIPSSHSGLHSGGLLSSVSSGMRELANVSSSAIPSPAHGPILHYGNPQAITLTLASQIHGGTTSNVTTSGGGVINLGSSGIGQNTSGAPSASNLSVHYGSSLPNQPGGIQPGKSYMVSNVRGPAANPINQPGGDSGDEGISVSIHVSNPQMGNDSMSGGSGGGGGGSQESSHSGGGTSTSEQRLKVEDALNYLDQVKYKFGNQPQVYNDFLDIMKEFKSQSIDTPGVIARVSHLFRGHPELIVGFNTFLPPGYKIEVQTNDQVSLSMLDSRGGYVVTTVQPANLAGQPVSSSSIIHPPSSSLPLRSDTGHGHHGPSAHSLVDNSGPPSNGRVSPNNLTSGLATSNVNNYEAGPTSTFTHSYTSPFVQAPMFPTLQSQPVEFNHAINYVNKIKNRFQGQPDKYKQFLEILHTYQKEQRNIKEGLPPSAKHLTEIEVYTQVSKLFENQDDLLQEFGQFLPDATNQPNIVSGLKSNLDAAVKKSAKIRDFPSQPKQTPTTVPKRTVLQPPKKAKLSQFRDITLSEAGKYGTLKEYAFFDKVRQLLRSQEAYDNFLRCLALYNEEILTRSELVQLCNPFLGKSPELLAWFKDFIGVNECLNVGYEPVPINAIKQEKMSEEQALEIDFSTCKRLGASYCALPKNHILGKCSGRNTLCKEVLNDIWVSFPTWSEDSTFITSRKTQFEEYIYRCEDERFELDVVIETNASTIRVLETVSKKISRMTPEELANFTLDDCLGGSSPTIHQRAIRRLYGDKASEIIQGLKSFPSLAVPIVLRRLKSKEEEWREAQKSFNRIWREQIERFYLKSLDHQGLTFKQGDMRALRSKALINEIETLFDERNEGNEGGSIPGSHMTLTFRDRAILDDACNLLLHHVRRQSGIQKDDKRRIKVILKQFIPDLFHHTRMDLSDDENEEGSHDEGDGRNSPDTNGKNGSKRNGKKSGGRGGGKKDGNGDDKGGSIEGESRRSMAKRELKLMNEVVKSRAAAAASGGGVSVDAGCNKPENVPGGGGTTEKVSEEVPSSVQQEGTRSEPDEKNGHRMIHVPINDDDSYTLFFVNNAWYIFLRLHQILCERLTKMYDCAMNAYLNDSTNDKNKAPRSPAHTLRLRPKSDVITSEFYPTFLEMVRNLLDGNMEMSVYEDMLREMFGIQAYIAYTMDKVITNSVRQLQTLVTDESCQKCLDFFQQADKSKGTGGLCATANSRLVNELAYQKKAEKAFASENCIKVIIYKNAFQMSLELLENTETSQEVSEENVRWSKYVDEFGDPHKSSDSVQPELLKPVFLPRNIRKWKKIRQQAYQSDVGSSVDSAPSSSVTLKLAEAVAKAKADGDNEDTDLTDHEEEEEIGSEPAILESEIEAGEKTEKAKIEGAEEEEEEEEEDEEMKSAEKKTGEKSKADEMLEIAELERKLAVKEEQRKKLKSPQLILQDNLQCKFNPNSYKMVYVVHSENFMYLKGALKRAREAHKKVTLRLNDSFGRWHQDWMEENCLEEQITSCEDWFRSAKNSMTKVISSNDISKPPYRPFNRYRVIRRGAANAMFKPGAYCEDRLRSKRCR